MSCYKKNFILSIACVLLLASQSVDAKSQSENQNDSRQARPDSAQPDKSLQDSIFVNQLAEDTWTYLSSDWATDNHLPWSWRSAAIPNEGNYANTAEMGFYALSWIAAYNMQQTWSPTWVQTESEVTAVLNQLRAWQTGSQIEQPHGPNTYNNSAFYQWYWISWSPPVVGANVGLNHLVSSVDNAWLAVSLITIREYAEANGHMALAQKADAILTDMDFSLWYHANTHLFSSGGVENPSGGIQADYYSNENRIINFVARALGDMNATEYSLSLAALNKSSGTYDGITVSQMAYDGSYFTYTGPALFIKEVDTPYGKNTIIPATQAQITYANNKGYQAWGLSDCFDIETGAYKQQGSPPAVMAVPESKQGLVSPHASAMALITPFAPDSITNLQFIYNTYNCAYDDMYGFVDSVVANPSAIDYGKCSYRFSALEQEWIFLSIANYQDSFIWDYFYRDEGVIQTHAETFEPVVINIVRASADPTGEINVDFTVTFSESVMGVDAADFTLTATGVSGPTVSGVSDSGSVYTVTVNTGSGSGTIRLDLIDNDTIIDAGFNALGGADTENGNFTSGETYTVTKTWIFGDVPASHWANTYIERLYNAGITGGCSTIPLNYCPEATVTRAQMAIFILRGIHGSAYIPPVATGTVFTDVPLGSFAADWIEQLAAEGVTAGCGGGNYCPDAIITRAEMAIFLLRGKHGSAYLPPPATGTVFNDVPLGAFAADWIEQLAAEGITGGCGGGNYCPDNPVTRAEMAVFLVRAFNLP